MRVNIKFINRAEFTDDRKARYFFLNKVRDEYETISTGDFGYVAFFRY